MNKLVFLIIILCYSCRESGNEMQIDYYENGDTLSIYNIDKEGLKNGEYRIYYPREILKEKGKYFDGKRVGINISYFKNGEISEYAYYDSSSVLVYYKKFNLEGEIINSALGMISPNKTFKREVSYNDSLLLSYKLIHSMYDDIYLKLKIRDKNKGKVIEVRRDTTLVEYYLKNFELGWNSYLINIYEIKRNNRVVVGEYRDSISVYANTNSSL